MAASRGLDVIVPRGRTAPVEQTGDEAQTYVRQGAAHVGIGADRYEVGRRMERELKPDSFYSTTDSSISVCSATAISC